MNLGRAIVLTFVVVALSVTLFAQSKKHVAKKNLLAAKVVCVSGVFGFKCPKGYKVLLAGKTSDGLFLAKSTEFRYSVFVAYKPSDDAMTELLPKILKAFLPNESQNFEWKDVVADPRKSSKFEVASKRRIGMNNGKAFLTLEYRQIVFNGNKLLTGTVVNGYEGPEGIKDSFERGAYTTNGGCFDSMDIIATLTKEKLDTEQGPCFFTLTMSSGN